MQKIQYFTDLIAWQKGHNVVLRICDITKSFPKEEMFGLTSQLRRAVVSITSNIAEGFSRSTYADKLRFYIMALGSVTEAQNQILIAKDLTYITNEQYTSINIDIVELHKLINGLIKKSRTFSS